MPKPRTLNELLDTWGVMEVAAIDQQTRAQWSSLDGWYAVANDDGIVAYFMDRSDAFRYRLAQINRELNG